MNVICISGKAQHGKDTTAGIIRERLEADGCSVLTVHYADLLKFICMEYFGWNGEKDDAGRKLLQYVGTDVVRAREPGFWVCFVSKFLGVFHDRWDYVVIPDTRFPNEVTQMKDSFPHTTHLRVVRTNFESPLTEEQQNHASETALDHVKPDIVVQNSGTIDDLKAEVNKVVDALVA